MKYQVTVMELLSRKVEVEASTPEDAIHEVNKQYCDSKIILDASDYVETNFELTGGDMQFGETKDKKYELAEETDIDTDNPKDVDRDRILQYIRDNFNISSETERFIINILEFAHNYYPGDPYEFLGFMFDNTGIDAEALKIANGECEAERTIDDTDLEM